MYKPFIAKPRIIDPWPQSQPRMLDGGKVGIMLLHGFTGTPGPMYELGDYLNERGFTVSIPRLAGHGTSIADMKKTGYADWMRSADEALCALKERCGKVAVAGLSMGGLLTLRLAAKHDDLMAACILSAPLSYKVWPAYMARALFWVPVTVRWPDEPQAPELPTYVYDGFPMRCLNQLLKLTSLTKRELSRINCPVQCIYTTKDVLVRIRSAEIIRQNVRSTQFETHTLHDSPHTSVIGNERQHIFELIGSFFTAQADGIL